MENWMAVAVSKRVKETLGEKAASLKSSKRGGSCFQTRNTAAGAGLFSVRKEYKPPLCL